jgi:hypothetical protein
VNFRLGLLALALIVTTKPVLAETPTPISQGSFRANDGNFTLLQLFTDSDDRFHKEWEQPTPPNLTTTHSAFRNKPVFMALILSGCAPDATGKCNVTGDIKIFGPTGKIYGDYKQTPIFNGVVSNPLLLMLSPTMVGMTVEDGEPLGQYLLVVTITDHVAAKSLTVEDSISVGEASNAEVSHAR